MKIINVDETFIELMEEYRSPNKDKGLLGACSENVVVFSERMLGIRLYAWQVEFLHEIQRSMADKELPKEHLAMTSRQIGKSTAVAILAIWASVFNKYPGTYYNNTLIGITSASDVQAKKLLRDMKNLMIAGDRHMALTYKDDNGPLFGETFFTDLLSEDAPNNTTTITFKPWTESVHGPYILAGSKNGSTIKSYPATSSVLGETFTVVIIDEAGKTDKISDEFFDEFLYPTGNSTNAVRIYISTPWVPSGFFYRLVDPDGVHGGTHAKCSVYTIDSIGIENPEYREVVQETIDRMNADGKTDEVQRAYYCRFVKGERSYFDSKKVFDVFDDTILNVESYHGPCDMGVDFGGKVASRTVITISMLAESGTVQRLYHRAYAVGEDENLLQDIEELLGRFNIQRIIPDECPQGDYLIRQMIEKGWEIQPMNFRAEKTKKYSAFRSFINKGKIKSYVDNELKTEMVALEQAVGKRQSVIQHAPGYSDDLIDSFVMSCYFFVDEEDDLQFFSMYDDD